MKEIILISVTGEDKPGLTSKITGVLASYSLSILDIGQAVIHNHLSLGFLVGVPEGLESASALKDLLFMAHGLGVQMDFTPIEIERYNAWVEAQGKPRYIITILARQIEARHVSRVAEIIAAHDLNIDKISRLSGRMPLEAGSKPRKACVELSLRGACDDDVVRSELFRLTQEMNVDISFQEDNIFRRNRRLVCFDMDSTLIESEVIDELARRAGVYDKVAAITERAMQGELDFDQSLKERVSLLKGLPETVLSEVAASLKLTEGAEKLIKSLRGLRLKTAIISGGFTYFGKYLQERLGIDYVYSNELEIESGRLTGRVTGEIVNARRKAELLRATAEREGIRLEQVIAVGDGANDLPMLSTAGLGIAFRAKPIVRESAEHAISTLGLDSILYLIGFRDRDTGVFD
jgi:phosphoserine phosphatase